MQNFIRNTQLKPGIVGLMVLMGITRFHHFGSALSLPDASIAVFFLAGLWSSRKIVFFILLLEAGLIDYIAISQFGVSDFCISPAYVFLLPTYAAVWFGGLYCAGISSENPAKLPTQIMVLLVTVSVAFVISNGSFYLLSDNIAEISWAQYSSSFIQYYPPYLNYAVIYVALIYALSLFIQQLPFIQAGNKTPKI